MFTVLYIVELQLGQLVYTLWFRIFVVFTAICNFKHYLQPSLTTLAMAYFDIWFALKIESYKTLYEPMIYGEDLASYWRKVLDVGARRTIYSYLKDMPNCAFVYVAMSFQMWYFDEIAHVWTCRNPSAALVALLRHTFYHDEFFSQFLQDMQDE